MDVDVELTESGADDPTTSNTATNSGLEKTLEELNLGAQKNVVYRYSVSCQFPQTNTWQKIPAVMKRSAKKCNTYLSEPSEESIHIDESIHTDCKVFCSLHCDFYNKAPEEWTKATDQEIYDMSKTIILRKNGIFQRPLGRQATAGITRPNLHVF